ncbi:MAG: diguanylate cyclase [Rhodocyclaceae bacterium]
MPVRLPGFLLRTRVTLIVVLTAFASAVAIGAMALIVAKRDMKVAIMAQQDVLLTTVASALDEKLALRRAALRAVANGVAAEVREKQPLQPFLLRYKNLRPVFDNLSIFDANGLMVATINNPSLIGRLNVASRSYFSDTLKSRVSIVSPPFLGQINKIPMLAITEPVLASDGSVAYVLAAIVDLQSHDFLGQFATTRVGRTGYMFIVTTDGMLVEHPVRSAILQPASKVAGLAPGLPRALSGFEGSDEGRSDSGEAYLYSFKRLTSTNWIVGAVYPAREAFAPIMALEEEVVLAGLLLAVLAGGLAWFVTLRQLQPLEELRSRIGILSAGGSYQPFAATLRQDEIGELAKAFENLITELNENRELLQTVTDGVPALIAYVNTEQRYRFNNKAFVNWFGYPTARLQGMHVRDLLDDASYAQARPYLERALAGERVTYERSGPDSTGRMRHLSATYQPHIGRDGKVVGLYAMVLDITDRKLLELELQAQARQDPLTGLPNRLELMSRLRQAAARADRARRPFALLFLDLDGFKEVNDDHGHVAGDELLKEVACRLRDNVRKSDTVARLGGDEFMVIVESFEAEQDAINVAQKLLAVLAVPVRVGEKGQGGVAVVVTASIGVAFYTVGTQTPEDLITEADTAMYTAKVSGKNAYFVAPRDDDPVAPAP